MAQELIQGQKYKLFGGGVTATATTIVLQSFTTPDGTDITTSLLGTTNYGTLEPGTSREEIISFTGVTQNSDDTADLTGVTRGLKFTTPYTADTGLRKAHAGGTIFVMSNNPQVYEDLVSASNDETITGKYTFSTAEFPEMSDNTTDPVDGQDLATKRYVDDVASGGSVSQVKVVVEGDAGETVAAGEVVYLDETANEWKLADASASATCDNVQLAIAQGAGTDGNSITGGVLLIGRDANQAGFAQGDKIYISDVAGTLATSAGTVEVEVGHAVSATAIDFTPKFASYTTELQRDALAGTSGTPSSTNKFVTNDDTSATAAASKLVRSGAGSKIVEGYLQTTDANMTTLTDGSDADALHTHGTFELVDGPGDATTVKDYWVFSIPWLISSDVPTTNFWTTTVSSVTGNPASMYYGATGDTGNNILNTGGIFNTDVGGNYLKFDDAKAVIVEFGVLLNATGTGQIGFGLSADGSCFGDFDRETSDDAAFTIDTSGNLYAHTADAGVGHTNTAITGITLTNWNTYRIEFDPGVDVKFYINGTLEATNTTNLPNGATAIKFGCGSSGTGGDNDDMALTEPKFAIEK
jgi:hypothetical protein